MGSSGTTMTMPAADAGYTGAVTFSTNNAPGNINFTMSWASGLSQILGNFVPGALTSSIGTPLLYLDFNTGTAVTFTQTPAINVTSSNSPAFPGSSCGFAVYAKNNGNTPQWTAMTTFGLSEVATSGSSFTIAAQSLGQANKVQFQQGDTYVALYCH